MLISNGRDWSPQCLNHSLRIGDGFNPQRINHQLGIVMLSKGEKYAIETSRNRKPCLFTQLEWLKVAIVEAVFSRYGNICA